MRAALVGRESASETLFQPDTRRAFHTSSMSRTDDLHAANRHSVVRVVNRRLLLSLKLTNHVHAGIK